MSHQSKHTTIIINKDYRISFGAKRRFFFIYHRPCYKRKVQGYSGYYFRDAVQVMSFNTHVCGTCNAVVPQEVINKVAFIAKSQ